MHLGYIMPLLVLLLLFVVQIPAFYQQPPGPGVVPWPQATSPGYFEAAAAVSAGGNFVHFPPQQAFAGKVEPERETERD